MNYFLKIVCGVFLVVTVGFGCRDSDAGANVDARVEIDRALKLYAEKPAAWDRVKFNTLYKNPRTQSGFSYVAGGSNFGFGARSEDEAETLVSLRFRVQRRQILKKISIRQRPSGGLKRQNMSFTPQHRGQKTVR